METPPALSIYCSQAYDTGGRPIASLNIVWQDSSVVVGVLRDEIDLFPRVHDADWNQRGSVRIGQCVSTPVFWCADDRGIALLVGPDDESWGVSMNLPACALEQIMSGLNEHRDWLTTALPLTASSL